MLEISENFKTKTKEIYISIISNSKLCPVVGMG